MFKVILIITSLLGPGQIIISVTDRQEKTCEEFLVSKDYLDYRTTFISTLESQGLKDIVVQKEECISLNDI